MGGEIEEARSIDRAVDTVLMQHITTPDLGGSYSTIDVSNAITKLIT